MELRDHLTQPLEDGGHGHERGGYVFQYIDPATLHEEDHEPGAWWAEAITHGHPSGQWT